MPGREALDDQRERGRVRDAVREREDGAGRRHGVLRVAAGADERDDALAVDLARDLAARDQRQLVGGEVGVLAGVGVGEVDAGAADADQHLALAGLGDGRVLDELEHLRAAERGDRDRAHREPHATVPRLMSLTVVGSIAFDAVETQTGSRDRLLGGSAVHFSLASSFFADTRVVGPVGDDFGEPEYAALHSRGVITDDIEHVPGGKTFFWAGRYERDVNIRHTLQTDLNVFEHFQPSLSEASAAADVVFLANIQPDLQREVREQCADARFVALDSMNLWIDIAHESLMRTIQGVDGVILNDGELKQLTDEPNLVRAAHAVLDLGPTVVVAKQGEYGSALFTRDGYFALPAYPTPDVVDPTGAGDTFAGGFMGYIAAHPDEAIDEPLLRRAMAYGTVLASFNVEAFGPERMLTLSREEIAGRVAELHASTSFDDAPIALR